MQTISAITAAQSLLNQQGKMHPLLVIELTDMNFTRIRSALKCKVGKCTSPAKESIACEVRSINSKPQKGIIWCITVYIASCRVPSTTKGNPSLPVQSTF